MERQALDAELMRATELLSRGKIDESLALMASLEEATAAPADQAEVWARYATIFAVLELTEEMQGAIHRALMYDADNPRANYLRGVQLMADQDLDGAIAALHRAASLYPPSDRYHLAEVYGNLGYCHDMQGDGDRATLYWEMAVELDPQGEGDGDGPAEPVTDNGAAPPAGCGALERVEAMLRQFGALGESESLFADGDDSAGEEDDDYWRIDEDEPSQGREADAPRKKAPSRGGRGRRGGRR